MLVFENCVSYDAASFGVLQRVAVCCVVLQCVAMCCNVLQRII